MTTKVLRFLLLILALTSFARQASADPIMELEQLFTAHKNKIHAPGFAVSVVKDGKVVFERGYGLKRAGDDEPFAANTIIGIGSLAKSFTAMMILQLYEQGKLNIDDPVVQHLPWFRTADKAKSDKVTIRMLLNMTSGIEPRFSQLLLNQSRKADALEKGVRNLSSYRIKGEPGESFQYINEGWNILGLIIEKIRAMPWEQALAENILAPLDMASSSSDRRVIENWDVATGHYAAVEPIASSFIHMQNSLPAGSGFYSTASDLANYMIALLNKGAFRDKKLLTENSVNLLWEKAVSLSILPIELGGTGEPGAYAMGWMRMDIDGIDYVFHGGEFRVSSSLMLLDPQNQSGVVILYNSGDLDPYTSESKIYVANNALRILRGRSFSNFGVPKGADPTINSYSDTVSMDQSNKLVGTYLSKSGRRIDIEANHSSHLTLHLQESVYPAWFHVDLVNRTNFVARNIANSYTGYFVHNADNDVVALNFMGEVFRKHSVENVDTKLHQISAIGMQFRLPQSWKVRTSASGFNAVTDDLKTAELSGEVTQKSYEQWLIEVKQEAASEKVVELNEFTNGLFLQSAVYRDRDGYSHLSIYSAFRDKNYIFSIKSSADNITHLSIDVLTPFINSLSFSGKQ